MAQAPAPAVAPPVASPPLTPLDAETQYPDEPIQAGLPLGPGPGSEVLGVAVEDDLLATLQSLYQKWPLPEIADQIQFEVERRRR